MHEVRINLGPHSYSILIGRGIREKISGIPGRKLLAADSNVARLYGSWAQEAAKPDVFHSFPAGEAFKTLDTVAGICSAAAGARLDRRSAMIALGGGVTGDLTGFAAAIYLRGVDFYQMPSTLLAMVDSSVGGKTGADLPEGKNLIGAFHQPRQVLIDPGFLDTLPVAELSNGLAEVVKTAMILDPELFDRLSVAPQELLTPAPRYDGIIARCCELKGEVVSSDEKESGRRAILNYGHTVGHAVEMLSGFTIAHGSAVAIGMAAAGSIAVELGWMTAQELRRQNELLKAFGLPVSIPAGIEISRIPEVMLNDKKARDGKIVFVLPRGIGNADVCTDVPLELIEKAVKEVSA